MIKYLISSLGFVTWTFKQYDNIFEKIKHKWAKNYESFLKKSKQNKGGIVSHR